MRSYNHGRFQQQASFLRRQFLQDGDLPFTDVLSEGIVAQALAAIERRLARQDLFTAGDAVGLLGPGPQRRSFVPRRGRSLDRPSSFARTTSVLADDGRYCQARKRLPEKFFSEVACLVGRRLGRQGRLPMALERTARLHVRRNDGEHARHAGESSRLSAGL